jgi:hypothetical protein
MWWRGGSNAARREVKPRAKIEIDAKAGSVKRNDVLSRYTTVTKRLWEKSSIVESLLLRDDSLLMLASD